MAQPYFRKSRKLTRQMLAPAESSVQPLPPEAHRLPSYRHYSTLDRTGRHLCSVLKGHPPRTHHSPLRTGPAWPWTAKLGGAGELSEPQCSGCTPDKAIRTPGGGTQVTAFAKAPETKRNKVRSESSHSGPRNDAAVSTSEAEQAARAVSFSKLKL